MITIDALIGSLELGMIYSILALGVFLSFRTLNTPDLTVDGSIVTGAAVSAMLCTLEVHPLIGLVAAFAGGACAGAVTAILNTKLKIQPLLAGILVMLGIYSINLRIMGGKANLPLTRSETIYSQAEELLHMRQPGMIVGAVVLAVVIAVFYFFLKTRMGFALRATGDNEDMVRASGISSDGMKLLGLSVSNGFVGLAGGLLAQYQGYCDIGMGVGMVVIGLASVIIGEVVFLWGSRSLLRRLIAVALGAVLYRLVLAVALSQGMQATDMKLVSAVIVIIALSLGVLGESFAMQKKKRGAKNA